MELLKVGINCKNPILFFIPGRGLGGSTLYLIKYIEFFLKKEYTVYAVVTRVDNGSRFLNSLGVQTIHIKIPLTLNIYGVDKYNSGLRKTLIDIIKLIFGFPQTLFLLLKYRPYLIIVGDISLIQVTLYCKLLRHKVVTFIQTSLSPNKIKNYLVRKFIAFSDLIIGITPLHLNELNIMDELNNKCFSIHNTIDANRINKSKFIKTYKDLNIKTEYIIIFLGGGSYIKGSLEFIELSMEILSIRDDVTFCLLGASVNDLLHSYTTKMFTKHYELSRLKKIANFIKSISKSDNFKVLGNTDLALNFINVSDILISINNYPHFSRPVLEAWNFKKAVIVNDDKFGRYLVKDGDNGLIAKKGNIQSWKEKCNLILNDPKLKKHLGNNGYEKYIKNFDNDMAIKKINKIMTDKFGF